MLSNSRAVIKTEKLLVRLIEDMKKDGNGEALLAVEECQWNGNPVYFQYFRINDVPETEEGPFIVMTMTGLWHYLLEQKKCFLKE